MYHVPVYIISHFRTYMTFCHAFFVLLWNHLFYVSFIPKQLLNID